MKTISQEIHDNIGRTACLDPVEFILSSSKYDDNILKETNILLGQVISDLRNLNKTFNPDFVLRDGLLCAIDQVSILKRAHCYNVNFEKEGEAYFIKGGKEVILFRMIQEALHNVVKHAEAHNIEIRAKINEETAEFSVSDDGKGFQHRNPLKSTGMGLANLEERARLIDAKLEIFSFPGAGTNVIIRIDNAA